MGGPFDTRSLARLCRRPVDFHIAGRHLPPVYVTMTLQRRALFLLLRHRLNRSLARLDTTLPLGADPTLTPTRYPDDVRLVRRGGKIEIALPSTGIASALGHRDTIAALLYLFGHCPPEVETMTATCSDGHVASDGRFSPSSRRPDVISIPDRYFVLRRGFVVERHLAESHGVPWAKRSETLVWRGGANGDGLHPVSQNDAFNPRIIPRARLCMLLSGQDRIDAAIVSGQSAFRPTETFAEMGLVGASRPEAEWLGDKYAIDIDGWTNSWSNLIVRMHFGCCVLKVESPDGFRQWWYDRLIPWEHYVPVEADMSDLLEKIEWTRNHDSEASTIAANGQALARSMTLESETAQAVSLIQQNWTIA